MKPNERVASWLNRGKQADKKPRQLLVDSYAYHHERRDKSSYSNGYCFGVALYQRYNEYDADGKKLVKDVISSTKALAATGHESSCGTMAGIHDAAEERKSWFRR